MRTFILTILIANIAFSLAASIVSRSETGHSILRRKDNVVDEITDLLDELDEERRVRRMARRSPKTLPLIEDEDDDDDESV